MSVITITQSFKYAFRGVEVVEFGVGEQDVPDEVAEIAVREGWAVKAHESAPENKDAAPMRRRKATK